MRRLNYDQYRALRAKRIIPIATGANILPSLLWPWAIGVPLGFGFALWISAPGRVKRLSWVRGRRSTWIGHVLEGVSTLHTLVGHPRRYAAQRLQLDRHLCPGLRPDLPA